MGEIILSRSNQYRIREQPEEDESKRNPYASNVPNASISSTSKHRDTSNVVYANSCWDRLSTVFCCICLWHLCKSNSNDSDGDRYDGCCECGDDACNGCDCNGCDFGSC